MYLNKLFCIVLTICSTIQVAVAALNDTSGNTPPSKEKAASALANIAVPFEENRGQVDAKVAFQARTLAGPLFVTKTGELVWSLTPPPSLRQGLPEARSQVRQTSHFHVQWIPAIHAGMT